MLVQKSGYFARSAAAGAVDRKLIEACAKVAVEGAFSGTPGVAGMDEDKGGEVRVIEFERIKGGKPFDVTTGWFVDMMKEVNQH